MFSTTLLADPSCEISPGTGHGSMLMLSHAPSAEEHIFFVGSREDPFDTSALRKLMGPVWGREGGGGEIQKSSERKILDLESSGGRIADAEDESGDQASEENEDTEKRVGDRGYVIGKRKGVTSVSIVNEDATSVDKLKAKSSQLFRRKRKNPTDLTQVERKQVSRKENPLKIPVKPFAGVSLASKVPSSKISAQLVVAKSAVKRQRTNSAPAIEGKRSRARKISKKPKRPKTAYNYFQLAIRDELWEELTPVINCPKDRVSHNEKVARVIGKRWKALCNKERTVYQSMADRDKRRYAKEHRIYIESLKNSFEGKSSEDSRRKKKKSKEITPKQPPPRRSIIPADPMLDEKSSSSEVESIGAQDSEATTPTLENVLPMEETFGAEKNADRLKPVLPSSVTFESWKPSPTMGSMNMMKSGTSRFHIPEIPELSDVLMEFEDLA
mmetsp:Transcript_3978/g.9376  ORF Transcript_3978/g.9376 Transcript_3978/m.9376 type:complete len:442 (+) Transcript_3978:153-1478(+)